MTAVLDPFNVQVSHTQFENLHVPYTNWSVNLFLHIKNVYVVLHAWSPLLWITQLL